MLVFVSMRTLHDDAFSLVSQFNSLVELCLFDMWKYLGEELRNWE